MRRARGGYVRRFSATPAAPPPNPRAAAELGGKTRPGPAGQPARHAPSARLLLPHLAMRVLDAATVQLTDDSHVTRDNGVVEHAHRSSIWSRAAHGWVLRCHQGTPFAPAATPPVASC